MTDAIERHEVYSSIEHLRVLSIVALFLINLSIGPVMAGPVSETSDLAISGGNSAKNSILFEKLGVSGTPTDRDQGVNSFIIRDTVDAGTNLFTGLYLRHQYGGGKSTGSRFGIYSYFSVDQAPCECDLSIKNYTAGTFQSYAKVPAKPGLKGGSKYSDYAGALWGSDDDTNLSGNAKNWDSLVGHEIGVALYSGASAADRFGLAIYSGGDAQGTLDDAGIVLASNRTRTPMRYGIEFGGTRKNFPTSDTGTMIGATARTQGPTMQPEARYGVDFRAVKFGSGGAAFASNGFAVDPAGNVKGASLTTGGASILSGAGSPEGKVSCTARCLYIRTDGGVGSTLYVNETGGGTSGWAAK